MKVDPRSKGFDSGAPESPRRLTLKDQTQYFEQGYLLLKDVIPETRLAALITDADQLEAEREAELRSRFGGQFLINRADDITFTTHIVVRSSAARAFALDPLFKDLCHDLIGDQSLLYWDQLVYKKPETEQEFPWHQDNGYTFVVPEAYLTCWVPLTPATKDNGCPWVVPRAHLFGTLEHWETPLGYQCLDDREEALETPIAIEANPGDVVLFSSLTPHRTGPNLTEACRKAYILQYAPTSAVMHPRGMDPVPLPFDHERHLFMGPQPS